MRPRYLIGNTIYDNLNQFGHPERPSIRQAVGVWPDHRRKARVNALASE
jgi:hypothetical protein